MWKSARTGMTGRLLAVQLLIALAAIALPAFAPPAQGRMLLVPLFAASARDLPARAIADGALLVGTGPMDGSLVISGERARLVGPLLRRGVVVLSAPSALCGNIERDKA